MKYFWLMPLMAILVVQCKKTDTPASKATLCLTNKTENDFTGYSFVNIQPDQGSPIQNPDLAHNGQICVEVPSDQASGPTGTWSAILESNDQYILASWTGHFNIAAGQTGAYEINASNKNLDFRRKFAGNYQISCHCITENPITHDTLSTTAESLLAHADTVPNVLYLRFKAGSYVDTLIKYKNDVFVFDAPGGTVTFTPSDTTIHFDITNTISPSITRRCQASGHFKL